MNCAICLEHVEEYISCECGKAYCFDCWIASPRHEICSCCKHDLDFYQPTLSAKNKRRFIHKLTNIYNDQRESKRKVYYNRGQAIINNLIRIEEKAEKYGGHIENKPYDKLDGVHLTFIHKVITNLKSLLDKPNLQLKNGDVIVFFNVTDKDVGETNLQAVQDMIRNTKATGLLCGGCSIPLNVKEISRSLVEDLYDALQHLRLKSLAEEYAAYSDYYSWNCSADRETIIKYGKRVILSSNEPITCCECGGVVRKVDNLTMKCEDCIEVFCMKCGKPFAAKHTCNEIDLEEWSTILKTTKACPKCGFRFAKKEGTCNDAYCTRCDTGFRYDTGKLIKHPFENPERKAAIERKRKEEKLDIFTMMYALEIRDISYEILGPLNIASSWRNLIHNLIYASRGSAGYKNYRFMIKKIRPHLLDLAVNLTRQLASMNEMKFEEWDKSKAGRGGSLTNEECSCLDELLSSFIKRVRMFGDNGYTNERSMDIIKPIKILKISDRFPETLKSLSYKVYKKTINNNQILRTQYDAVLEEIALDDIAED